jgi:FO synthase
MNLQAPPNLNPTAHRLLLRAGINDWGGISPLTADYVNPEAPWPHVAKLATTCAEEGFTLLPRLAVYPEFVEREGFLDPRLRRGVIAEQRRIRGELREAAAERNSSSSEAAACQRPS